MKQFYNERKEKQEKFKNDDTLDKIKAKLSKIDPLFKFTPQEEIFKNMMSINSDLDKYLNSFQPIDIDEDETTLENLKNMFTSFCQPYYNGQPLTAA